MLYNYIFYAENAKVEKKYGQNKKKSYSDRKTFDSFSYEKVSNECIVSGRNAVRELLQGERDVEKIYIQSGEREGSIKLLLSMAKEKKIPVSEVDRTRLDTISCGERHQGIVAIAAERNYATVDDIL